MHRFDQLIRTAHQMGGVLDGYENRHHIYLGWLERHADQPVGTGAAVLGLLCRYADQHRKEVRLMVKHGDGRLVRYYERFGFVLVADDGEMRRAPDL